MRMHKLEYKTDLAHYEKLTKKILTQAESTKKPNDYEKASQASERYKPL